MLGAGLLFGAFKHLNEEDKRQLTIELISNEALKTSEIEGEYLDRDSLQSSIRRQFGLIADNRKISPAEQGIAEMMVDVYRNFEAPLSHAMLFEWHKMLTNGRRDLNDIGRYRTHNEPMQIVSGAIHAPKVHFEAPPSSQMMPEMERGSLTGLTPEKHRCRLYCAPLLPTFILSASIRSKTATAESDGRLPKKRSPNAWGNPR